MLNEEDLIDCDKMIRERDEKIKNLKKQLSELQKKLDNEHCEHEDLEFDLKEKIRKLKEYNSDLLKTNNIIASDSRRLFKIIGGVREHLQNKNFGRVFKSKIGLVEAEFYYKKIIDDFIEGLVEVFNREKEESKIGVF